MFPFALLVLGGLGAATVLRKARLTLRAGRASRSTARTSGPVERARVLLGFGTLAARNRSRRLSSPSERKALGTQLQSLVSRARSVPIAESRKRAVASQVGSQVLDVISILQGFADECRAKIDGDAGDDMYRRAAFLHDLVGASLSEEMLRAWSQEVTPALQNWYGDRVTQGDPFFSLWPTGSGFGLGAPSWPGWPAPRPSDPHGLGWDENPEGFAAQLAKVDANLRYYTGHVYAYGLPEAPNAVTWPPAKVPPEATESLHQAQEVLESETVTTLLEALGMSEGSYAIPVLGWCIAIIDAIVELCYAIFGTASAVENISFVPLTAEEIERWELRMAGVNLWLRKLYEECQQIAGGKGSSVELRLGRKMASAPP